MVDSNDFSNIESEFSKMSDQEKEETVEALRAIAEGLKTQPKPKKKNGIKTAFVITGLTLLIMIIGILITATIYANKVNKMLVETRNEIDLILEDDNADKEP